MTSLDPPTLSILILRFSPSSLPQGKTSHHCGVDPDDRLCPPHLFRAVRLHPPVSEAILQKLWCGGGHQPKTKQIIAMCELRHTHEEEGCSFTSGACMCVEVPSVFLDNKDSKE